MKKYVQKISKYRPAAMQGSFHFQVARPRLGLAMEFDFERHALSVFSILLGVLIFAYLYFVVASIFNVMGRAEALRQTQQLQLSVASLEHDYFALSEDVSPASGQAIGLAPVRETSYVYRPGNAAVATMKGNTI